MFKQNTWLIIKNEKIRVGGRFFLFEKNRFFVVKGLTFSASKKNFKLSKIWSSTVFENLKI